MEWHSLNCILFLSCEEFSSFHAFCFDVSNIPIFERKFVCRTKCRLVKYLVLIISSFIVAYFFIHLRDRRELLFIIFSTIYGSENLKNKSTKAMEIKPFMILMSRHLKDIKFWFLRVCQQFMSELMRTFTCFIMIYRFQCQYKWCHWSSHILFLGLI